MFIVLLFSTTIVLLMGTYIFAKIKNKRQMHHIFLLSIFFEFLWCLSIILDDIYVMSDYRLSYLLFPEFLIMMIGISFFPVSFLLMGIIFRKSVIKFNFKYLLLLISPTLNVLLFITNKYHHLSFKSYYSFSNLEWGPYFIFNMIYSYFCLAIGFIYLIYFSIKNAGYFSKQVKLIIIGSLVPLIANILSVISVFYNTNLPQVFRSFQAMPISISFTIVCYALAIFKFDFLNVVPIALQKVVDLISDGFVVIDEEFNIIDYNKTLIDSLNGTVSFKRKENIIETVDKHRLFDISKEDLENIIKRSVEKRKSSSFEQHIEKENLDKHFTIEITPIFNQDKHIGTIILLKDITEHKKNLDTINRNNEELTALNEELNEKNEEMTALNEELIATNDQLADNMDKLNQTQNQLVESERLASLGQLIGGIAHNLKTPIMSIAGGVEAIEDLAAEIEEDTAAGTLEKQDYIEIAKEIKDWTAKMKEHQAYMSDIITTVKGQAVQMSATSIEDFAVDELLKRIEILMKHELKKAYCTMNTDVLADKSIKLTGEINNLVQVLNNLITNAIQAYDEQGGVVDFRVAIENNNIMFAIKDSGKGIPKEIQEKLFNSMITTKGKKGTGLGLYMSYSTIKGKFGGNMWFESEEGKGTTFYVTIPLKGGSEKKEVS